jgi:uncharacterized membrane protein (Fun14 family)|mmetsp:Transcript_5871/g.19510  ORF Transcript_5871/g.19510 Transcript_5871/m.19510 type:complete len:229 (+) Transcript_5871:192-878(+)|eukprot:CAMPEP_0119212662 /NCGR_PEP_ID=MMETSP1327-20130426/4725_1 /TAXON_ID=38833 /ORGANISM="Micromonas pusilla, Strain RCC2306" /LENGTH=228 /DNA_ID=CAMNT_0007210041 /DNA_START=145 /DNA_END=831 /DNA_ORIENTATION=+
MFTAFSISASAARPAVKLPSSKATTSQALTPMSAMGGGNNNNNNRGGGGGGGGDNNNNDGEGSNSEEPRKFRFSRLALTMGTLALSSVSTSAHAGKKPVPEKKKPKTQIAGLDVGDFALLFGSELGISGAVGVGCGIMAKAAAKTSLLVLAAVYAFLRWLELNDIVDVKYENLAKLAGKTAMIADLNKDGKIDAKDVNMAKAKAVGFFGSALPSVTGFSAGIAIGLKL